LNLYSLLNPFASIPTNDHSAASSRNQNGVSLRAADVPVRFAHLCLLQVQAGHASGGEAIPRIPGDCFAKNARSDTLSIICAFKANVER